MSNQKRHWIERANLGFFFLAIILNLNILTLESSANEAVYSQSTTEETEVETESKSEEVNFSSSGRSGQQTAGESRGGCSPTDIPLTAIAAKSNTSKTLASHPRWWFYLPYEKAEISRVEFVVQTENRKDILREDVTASVTSNYFSTTLPKVHPGIETSHLYRWYLKVYCTESEDTVPLYVSGWVQRVALDRQTPNLKQTISAITREYVKQDLWLDAIDLLLKNHSSNIQTANWQEVWLKTIRTREIDLELPLPAP